MNGASNQPLSFAATFHTVRPLSSALSSGHFRMAPPQCISSGAQSLESSDVTLGMLISSTGIPSKNRIGLRGDSCVPMAGRA